MPAKWESAPRRAWKDTRRWLPSSIVSWLIIALIPAGAGVLIALLVTPPMSTIEQVSIGALGSVLALIIILIMTFAVHLVLALIRQRNEARQLSAVHDDNLEFMRNIKSGDIISNKEIDISFLIKQQEILNNVTFSCCDLKGPSVLLILGNSEMGGCSFNLYGGRIDDIFIKLEPGRKYTGVGIFTHCKFLNCNIEKLAFIVNEKTIKMFKEVSVCL